jgi:integrase
VVIVRRKPLSPNKDAAKLMLADLLKTVESEKGGVRDTFSDHRKTPLVAHLAAWGEVLAARGNSAEYVKLKVSRARKLLDACGFVFIGDLSASAVEAALADMRPNPRCGIQTSNHYLAAVKQFARWLVKDRRAAHNPLAHLEGGNVKLDRRHDRRDLSEEELGRLFAATRAGERVRRLSGPDRDMLYLTSVYTGLRASELASLIPESFALDDRPTVTVEAAYSKRRREDVIPLHPEIVTRLRPWLAAKAPGTSVWPGGWAKGKKAGVMLQHDLEAARAAWIAEATDPRERDRRERSDFLAYRDAAGRCADFHALRHSFITRLVKAGIKPKEAQTLARHSTITLTMDRYTHVGLHDSAAAVESLPGIPGAGPASEPAAMRATGTDGGRVSGVPADVPAGGNRRVRQGTIEETSGPRTRLPAGREP